MHRTWLLAVAAGALLVPTGARAQDSPGDRGVPFPRFVSDVRTSLVSGATIAPAGQGSPLVIQRQGWSTYRAVAAGALIGGGVGAATGCALGLASGEDGAALYAAGLFGVTGAATGAAAALVSRRVYRRGRRATPSGGARWKAILAGAGTGAALGMLTGVLVVDRDRGVVGAWSGALGGTTGSVVAAAIAHR